MFIVLTMEMQEYLNNHTMYRTERFLMWYCVWFTSLHNYLASAWVNNVRDYNEQKTKEENKIIMDTGN